MTTLRKPYPTDLSDAEWAILEPLLPPKPVLGRPRADLREVCNGIFYIVDNGAKWRAMPHEFPNWDTCYGWYKRLKNDGTFDEMTKALREADREGKAVRRNLLRRSLTPSQ